MICYSSHRKVIHNLLKQVGLEKDIMFKILQKENSALDLTTTTNDLKEGGETERERDSIKLLDSTTE